MRYSLHRRKNGRVLLWLAFSLLLIQLGLGLVIDQCCPSIRDPHYQALQELIQRQHRLASDRPLFLALGSSRTLLALKAELLNQSTDPTAPLVMNAALSGSGPMLQLVTLQRLLRADLHPDLVFLETMPEAVSRRGGAPLEERHKWTHRYRGGEVASILGYYAESYRLLYPWIQARIWPTSTYQKDLHQAFLSCCNSDGPASPSDRDSHGWSGCPREFTQEEIDRLTRDSLNDYSSALKDPVVAPGPIHALEKTILLCQEHSIAVVLVVPPESSTFRNLDPDSYSTHLSAIQGLSSRMNVALVDASRWISDDGFWDGHHATRAGADQYTRRFAIEVLSPLVQKQQIVQRTP